MVLPICDEHCTGHPLLRNSLKERGGRIGYPNHQMLCTQTLFGGYDTATCFTLVNKNSIRRSLQMIHSSIDSTQSEAKQEDISIENLV
jgi:hypothetical protein